MKRVNLAPGVYLNTLDAEKFNRCRVTIRFQYPARRCTIGKKFCSELLTRHRHTDGIFCHCYWRIAYKSIKA